MAEEPFVSGVNAWIGAETGLLKSVDLVKKVATNHYAHVGKNYEVLSMCWDNNDSNMLFSAHLHGKIRKFELKSNSYTDGYNIPGYEVSKEKVVSVYKTNDKFITCTDKGHLKLWNSINDTEWTDDDNNDVTSIDVGHNILCTAYNPLNNYVATGGYENCLKLWDLNKPNKAVFRSKNVKPDWLQLRVPIYVVKTAFVPESNNIVTTTGTHHVRVYDPKASDKRPVMETEFAEHPITALSACERDPSYIFVGNTRGVAARYDLRKLKRMVRGYKGFAGSIRSIGVHKTQPYVFFCGLDRHLCVHDEKFAKPKYKVYLKSRLNCLLVSEADVEEQEPVVVKKTETRKRKLSECSDDNVDEDDEMWNKMTKIDDDESDVDDDDTDSDV